MREPGGYATPAAFRRALTDKLKALASASRWPLPQLQRQIAYDRLLERLYLADDQWIVKGATALLARDLGVRATIDVDLYRPQAGQSAEAQLRAAVQRDIGDWFRFEIGPARPVTAGTTSRLPVTAIVGATVWVSFHVDLAGEDLRMTGPPDDVPPLARVLMPGIQQHGYRAYPQQASGCPAGMTSPVPPDIRHRPHNAFDGLSHPVAGPAAEGLAEHRGELPLREWRAAVDAGAVGCHRHHVDVLVAALSSQDHLSPGCHWD
ncbi:MAG TPA: nucleotidyl transferase AbiEii/AbiGii toxin family protein [Streptosporangiaceae bacterium]|nr:nucleotidyl transferase AbiEii/AbiGii toxin family protein [Streptosporangiaceae bacterium]